MKGLIFFQNSFF